MDNDKFIYLTLTVLENIGVPDIKRLQQLEHGGNKILFYAGGRPEILNVTNDCFETINGLVDSLKEKDSKVNCNDIINKIKEKFISEKSLYAIIKEGDNSKFLKLEELTIFKEALIRNRIVSVAKYKCLFYRPSDLSISFTKIITKIQKYENSEIDATQLSNSMPSLIKSFFTECKTYLDTTNKYINDNYSFIVDFFKTSTSEEYDNNFGYRYCDQLRNALQHSLYLPYDNQKVYLENNSPKINFMMKNQTFIDNYKKLKALVKKELQLNPHKNIDIIEQITIYFNCIINIHDKLISKVLTKHQLADMLYLYKIKVEYLKYDNFIIVNGEKLHNVFKKLYTVPNIDVTYDDSMEVIPIEFIQLILRESRIISD